MVRNHLLTWMILQVGCLGYIMELEPAFLVIISSAMTSGSAINQSGFPCEFRGQHTWRKPMLLMEEILHQLIA